MKKNETFIEETKTAVNQDVKKLFQSYLQYEIAISMEEIKVYKLRASILQARELQEEAKLYDKMKVTIEKKVSKVSNFLLIIIGYFS